MNTDNLLYHSLTVAVHHPRRNLCRKGNRRMVAEFQCHHIGASRPKNRFAARRTYLYAGAVAPAVCFQRKAEHGLLRLQHHLARQNLRRVRCSGYGNGSFQRKPHRIRCGRPTARFPRFQIEGGGRTYSGQEQPGNFYPRKLSLVINQPETELRQFMLKNQCGRNLPA